MVDMVDVDMVDMVDMDMVDMVMVDMDMVDMDMMIDGYSEEAAAGASSQEETEELHWELDL